MPQNNYQKQDGSDFILKNLPKPQKTAVIFLFIVAILVVVFWIIQMRSHINSPFNYGSGTASSTTEDEYIKALSKNDIDNDGLSDYDEMYTYSTSPYLEDTDSDGLTDKQEVSQGTDPNCAQGKNCSSSESVSATGSSTSDYIYSATNVGSGATSSTEEENLQKVLSGEIDAATLRQLLISGGASQTDLDQISDEALMQSYQETLASQAASSSATSTQ